MKILYYFLLFGLLTSCTAAEVNRFIQGATEATLTEQDVSNGLKEALIKGISTGADLAAKEDGFFKNDLIRIALPADVQRVEGTLRRIGLGSEVDRVILTINRGAENAAREAKPIFIDAIRQLTVQDAWDILKGDEDAATQYLQRTSTDKLKVLFAPHVQEALDQVGATRYYGDLVNGYNSLPTTSRKLDPNLNAYVTDKAISGLFELIAREEKAIRENPAERTTALLRRVFAAQDN
ncbi:Protein of unknown function [Cyclobacterium lianum]|uniref:DUF4197 domain-containing protein n=1 Tax=Cyclobacterium lianum TaxID=388280 RepID=A0A1M7NCQ5_9BACT|nr:DUF4197 domain-containing protein [Cyclobacterium lianum]SHN01470.1 Protein of unknown function [Cyclobacterium lianum]